MKLYAFEDEGQGIDPRYGAMLFASVMVRRLFRKPSRRSIARIESGGEWFFVDNGNSTPRRSAYYLERACRARQARAQVRAGRQANRAIAADEQYARDCGR